MGILWSEEERRHWIFTLPFQLKGNNRNFLYKNKKCRICILYFTIYDICNDTEIILFIGHFVLYYILLSAEEWNKLHSLSGMSLLWKPEWMGSCPRKFPRNRFCFSRKMSWQQSVKCCALTWDCSHWGQVHPFCHSVVFRTLVSYAASNRSGFF